MLLLPVTIGAAPLAPSSNFSADVTTGQAPLDVQFFDESLYSPTGWAWFFGDETYHEPWTLVNGSAGWEGRRTFGAVVLKDGSVVLTGGYLVGWRNDTWRSTDKGNVWVEMNQSSGWPIRANHDSVALPDGSIVLMGGYGDNTYYNDSWRSTDKGATWTLMNASSGWLVRDYHSCVALPDGSIVLTGGSNLGSYEKNDTWRSTDNGATWAEINASSGWSAREKHSSTVMPDGSIILTGGSDGTDDFNDTWRSTDRGTTWTRMNAGCDWPARRSHSTVAMPDGSILLMGGYDSDNLMYNDVWLSADNGATWMAVNESAGWSPRLGHEGVGLSDGSVLLIGGVTGPFLAYLNDTWRFQPAGSTFSNPEHTYTMPGSYGVSLVVRNAGGFNGTRKVGYITVTGDETMVGVFRPSTHRFILDNGTEKTVVNWGLSTDTPVAGDWDGDGLAGVGVYRPSIQKFILKNGTERTVVPWGLSTDTPVTGDWNGDGLADAGVYRPSIQKFILKNGTERTVVPWGLSTDIPVSGDWNADGLSDVGVFRPSSQKFILSNGTERTVVSWGLSTDIPVTGAWS